jgi:translation initiation factor IF-2
MKIPAKNHASTLVDAYVDRIRKKLGPEMEERAAAAKAQKDAEEAQRAAEEAQRAAEEEARHKAEVERERAQREQEKAEREEREKQEDVEKVEDAPATEGSPSKKHDEANAQPKPIPKFQGLLSQIEAENKRLAAEKEAKAQKAQAAKQPQPQAAAAEKDKKKTAPIAEVATTELPTAATPPAGAEAPVAETAPAATTRKGKTVESEDGNQRAGRGKGKGKETKRSANQRYAEQFATQDDDSEEDRYTKMAKAAELLQRDHVLQEARIAVEAASNEGGGKRKKRKEKREAEAHEKLELEAIEKGIDPELLTDTSVVQITTGVTVAEFADALKVPSKDVIKRLFLLGSPLTVTQTMTDELVELLADDMDRKVRIILPEEEFAVSYHDSDAQLKPRPPVVTVMGHVDHGKTSLLDAIRETGVVATEAGGITQHIGASVVDIKGRQITFIDTPGHEAFTAMRARGAKVTDVVVLVVAADDGVMPQTVEAIHHAEAAGVPIVVAVNKIDKEGATPDRVRQELTEHSIIPEEWGGQNMFVDVSAKKRLNIDDLLETILLQADVLELRANPDALASGFVIEAKLDKGRGPVATVLVQRGTIKVGDAVVVGTSYGRVRALVSPKGENTESAKPADPVELLGLGSVPQAGDEFRVFPDERDARNLAEDRALRQRLAEQQKKARVTLEDLFARIEEGKMSELNLVVKADVQGSIEALQDALDKMDQSEVRINVIHSAVGGITETDVTLAAASDAIIIGFNVRPQPKARAMAEKEQVEIKTYRVIYQAIEEINAARVGLLSPDIVESDTGSAEVRELFKVPKIGTVAGCLVTEGEIARDDRIRLVRDGTVVLEGTISSLRRFKDDVKTVKAGYECGISITGFQDIKEGDILEGYRVTEVARES